MTPAEKILKALKEREWVKLDSHNKYCPGCGNWEGLGHLEKCTYAEAIREAEKMVEDQGYTETV